MLRIIILEDEEIIRRGLVYTIDWQQMGCCVVGDAGDGRTGLELIEKTQPDVVLTDIRMPRLDGLQLAETLREAGSEVQLVFLTSYADFSYAKRAIEVQAADYLLKPVDEEKLRQLMERLQARQKPQPAEPAAETRLDLAVWLADSQLNPYVRQVLEIIRQDYQARLSLDALAERLGVSQSYLSRKLKEATGQTFGVLLTRQRLQMAIRQLSQGTWRVYEVAEQNGFSDYKNFCTIFKKYMQISPREFMRRMTGGLLQGEKHEEL